jgi:hypothetical protein
VYEGDDNVYLPNRNHLAKQPILFQVHRGSLSHLG